MDSLARNSSPEHTRPDPHATRNRQRAAESVFESFDVHNTDIQSARNGYGHIALAQIDHQTRVIRSLARQPLKICAPRNDSPVAAIYVTTLGGGLVSGDQIHLNLSAGQGTTTFLTTQSATKVYRSINGLCTRQLLRATLDENALLIAWPDPIFCFEDANYEQHQRFDLHESASLVLVDWQASGRRARGERWAFSRYLSRNEIYIGNRQILNDATLLDQADDAIDSLFRAGRFECLATLILTGPPLANPIHQIESQINAAPLNRRAPLLTTASRTPHALIVRIAGQSPSKSPQQFMHS